MKGSGKIKIGFFLIAASFGFISCGEPLSQNQNVNLAQNQTTIHGQNIDSATARQENSSTASQINTAQKMPQPTFTPSLQDNSNGNDLLVIDKLIIPVEGVKRENLVDTFDDARSEGRVHDAIDIMAPLGTPVLAAADGEIARFFDSEKGGITIYQYSRNKKLIYYYAHLQRRADNLQEHQFVKQGTVIGYIGDTGNAVPGNTHLHFAVWVITDPKRYWDGTNINPYTLLH